MKKIIIKIVSLLSILSIVFTMITPIEIKAIAVPYIEISADEISFSSVYEGYKPIAEKTINFTNRSENGVTLSFTFTNDYFEIDLDSVELGASEVGQIKIKPVDDLPFKTYTDTLVVVCDDEIVREIKVSFVVYGYPDITISTGYIDFGNIYYRYKSVEPIYINFTNEVNVNNTLNLRLSGHRFKLSTKRLVVPANGEASVSITPIKGLRYGVYRERLTISRGRKVIKTITVRVRVVPRPYTRITPAALDFGHAGYMFDDNRQTKTVTFVNRVFVADNLTFEVTGNAFDLSQTSLTIPGYRRRIITIRPQKDLDVGQYSEKLIIKRGETVIKEIPLLYEVFMTK